MLTDLGPTGNFLVLSPLLAGCGRALWLRGAHRHLAEEAGPAPEENRR